MDSALDEGRNPNMINGGFRKVRYSRPAVDLLTADYTQTEEASHPRLQQVLDFVTLAAASPYGQRVDPAPRRKRADPAKLVRKKMKRLVRHLGGINSSSQAKTRTRSKATVAKLVPYNAIRVTAPVTSESLKLWREDVSSTSTINKSLHTCESLAPMLPITHGSSQGPLSRSTLSDMPTVEKGGGKVEPSFYNKSRSSNPKSMPRAARETRSQRPNKGASATDRVAATNRAVGLSATNVVVDENIGIEVSHEMQHAIETSLAQNLGSGFWADEFASPLARPLSATSYCSRQLQLMHPATSISLGGAVSTDVASVSLFPYNHEAHEAAYLIQHAWKQHVAFEQIAARKVQSAFRGMQARSEVARHLSEMMSAVVVIQSIMRGSLGRRATAREIHLAHSRVLMKVQQLFRGMQGRIKAQNVRRQRNERCATAVQSGFRGMVARLEVRGIRQVLRLNSAVLTAQTIFRGNRERRRQQESSMMAKATILVQRLFRQYRRRVTTEAASRIQRCFRSNFHSMACRRIQSGFRGFLGRFWCAKEKARRRALEHTRRMREMDALTVATNESVNVLDMHWKSKAGKREFKTETKQLRTAKKVQARERKKLAPKQQEVEAVRAVFGSFDVDQSGSISHEEFRQFVSDLCAPVTAEELNSAVLQIDKHESGLVEFDRVYEWLAVAAAMKHTRGKRAKLAVRRMRLRSKKFVRDLLGKSLRAETRRVLVLRKKAEVYNTELGLFRRDHPPPFAAPCTRAFVFQTEYQDYLQHQFPDLSNVDHLRSFYKAQFGIVY